MSKALRRCLAYVLLLAMLVAFTITTASAQDGRKTKVKVDPVYPELARRLQLGGVVKIEVVIAPAGTVKSTKVVGGNPVLVEAALNALRKWKYESGPEESHEIVEFHFNPTQ